MNILDVAALKKEVDNLSTETNITIKVTGSMALTLITRLQILHQSSLIPMDASLIALRCFCDDLLSQIPLSEQSQKAINLGWVRAIDFNNPVTPPDELA